MKEKQYKKGKNDRKDSNHIGVLSYMSKEKQNTGKELFYKDPLNKAFYEMYVLV